MNLEDTIKLIKLIQLQMTKTKDSQIQRDLRFAAHFLNKAVAKQKSNLKKEQKKLQKEAREIEAEQAEILREIALKRKTLQRKLT